MNFQVPPDNPHVFRAEYVLALEFPVEQIRQLLGDDPMEANDLTPYLRAAVSSAIANLKGKIERDIAEPHTYTFMQTEPLECVDDEGKSVRKPLGGGE